MRAQGDRMRGSPSCRCAVLYRTKGRSSHEHEPPDSQQTTHWRTGVITPRPVLREEYISLFSVKSFLSISTKFPKDSKLMRYVRDQMHIPFPASLRIYSNLAALGSMLPHGCSYLLDEHKQGRRKYIVSIIIIFAADIDRPTDSR